jgi:hypothetical protein
MTGHQPPSNNAAANTVMLILARLLLTLNPEARSKKIAYIQL